MSWHTNRDAWGNAQLPDRQAMPQAFRRILQVTLLLAGSLAPLSASADPTLLEPFEGLRYTDDLDSSHGMTWSRKTGTANGKET